MWKLDESSGEWTFKDAWKVGVVAYRHNALGSYWLTIQLRLTTRPCPNFHGHTQNSGRSSRHPHTTEQSRSGNKRTPSQNRRPTAQRTTMPRDGSNELCSWMPREQSAQLNLPLTNSALNLSVLQYLRSDAELFDIILTRLQSLLITIYAFTSA